MSELIKQDDVTSNRMRCVRTTDTDIEKVVRSTLHKFGFRFRLHDGKLPGKPDIILPRHKVVVFVHGCFWHGHNKCNKGRLRPKRNAWFWKKKIELNKKRDLRVRTQLEKLGWRVLTVWECEIKNKKLLNEIITTFFKVKYG